MRSLLTFVVATDVAGVCGLQTRFDKLGREIYRVHQCVLGQHPTPLLQMQQAEVVVHIGIVRCQRECLQERLF